MPLIGAHATLLILFYHNILYETQSLPRIPQANIGRK